MSRTSKTKTVAELTKQFRNSSGAVLTEYRGLTVSQLRELRTALRGHADYAVVKNTLTKLAAKDAGVEGFDELLVGPSAIAFITGDVVVATKGLKNFGKDHPALVVKGGYLDGKPLSPDEIKQLADLESREVLLAKLAGDMKASLSAAASLFNAPLAQAARTIEALRVKAEADPSVLAAGVGEAPAATILAAAPEAADTGAEAPVDEDVAAEVAVEETAGAEPTETQAAAPVVAAEVPDAQVPDAEEATESSAEAPVDEAVATGSASGSAAGTEGDEAVVEPEADTGPGDAVPPVDAELSTAEAAAETPESSVDTSSTDAEAPAEAPAGPTAEADGPAEEKAPKEG